MYSSWQVSEQPEQIRCKFCHQFALLSSWSSSLITISDSRSHFIVILIVTAFVFSYFDCYSHTLILGGLKPTNLSSRIGAKSDHQDMLTCSCYHTISMCLCGTIRASSLQTPHSWFVLSGPLKPSQMLSTWKSTAAYRNHLQSTFTSESNSGSVAIVNVTLYNLFGLYKNRAWSCMHRSIWICVSFFKHLIDFVLSCISHIDKNTKCSIVISSP